MTNENGKASPDLVNSQNMVDHDKMPKLASLQAYTMMRVPRSMVKNAPYNPRVISDRNRRKLKRSLEKNKLVEPLIWNKRTGNLVGGHQRLSIIDQVEGTDDYSLEMSVIDVDQKKEMEINIALNNPATQGEFELTAMTEMYKDFNLDVEATGFDQADLFQLMGCDPTQATGVNLMELADQTKEIRERHDKVKEAMAQAADPNFYSVLVFPTYKERLRFTYLLGAEDNRYLNGMLIAEEFGMDLSKPCPLEREDEDQTEGDANEPEPETEGGEPDTGGTVGSAEGSAVDESGGGEEGDS